MRHPPRRRLAGPSMGGRHRGEAGPRVLHPRRQGLLHSAGGPPRVGQVTPGGWAGRAPRRARCVGGWEWAGPTRLPVLPTRCLRLAHLHTCAHAPPLSLTSRCPGLAHLYNKHMHAHRPSPLPPPVLGPGGGVVCHRPHHRAGIQVSEGRPQPGTAGAAAGAGWRWRLGLWAFCMRCRSSWRLPCRIVRQLPAASLACSCACCAPPRQLPPFTVLPANSALPPTPLPAHLPCSPWTHPDHGTVLRILTIEVPYKMAVEGDRTYGGMLGSLR